LRQPTFIVNGQEVDLTDLTKIHTDRIGGAPLSPRRGFAGTPFPASTEELLVIVDSRTNFLEHYFPTDTSGCVIIDVVDFVVDRDPDAGQGHLHLVEDVTSELHMAQGMSNVFCVN
jgi:hypothetical protein